MSPSFLIELSHWCSHLKILVDYFYVQFVNICIYHFGKCNLLDNFLHYSYFWLPWTPKLLNILWFHSNQPNNCCRHFTHLTRRQYFSERWGSALVANKLKDHLTCWHLLSSNLHSNGVCNWCILFCR